MPKSMLIEILQRYSAAAILKTTPPPEQMSGEVLSFPFLGIVG